MVARRTGISCGVQNPLRALPAGGPHRSHPQMRSGPVTPLCAAPRIAAGPPMASSWAAARRIVPSLARTRYSRGEVLRRHRASPTTGHRGRGRPHPGCHLTAAAHHPRSSQRRDAESRLACPLPEQSRHVGLPVGTGALAAANRRPRACTAAVARRSVRASLSRGGKLTCVYSTDPIQFGQTIVIEARNGEVCSAKRCRRRSGHLRIAAAQAARAPARQPVGSAISSM